MQSVLEFHRNVVANRLATDAPSWVALFSKYNSGTCQSILDVALNIDVMLLAHAPSPALYFVVLTLANDALTGLRTLDRVIPAAW